MLTNRVVIITGASSGIGAASAKQLAAAGAKLTLIARRQDRLEHLKQMFPDADILIQAVDVTDPQAMQQAVAATITRFGRVDVLFNNAGIMPTSRLDEQRIAEWRRMVDVNIMGVLNEKTA